MTDWTSGWQQSTPRSSKVSLCPCKLAVSGLMQSFQLWVISSTSLQSYARCAESVGLASKDHDRNYTLWALWMMYDPANFTVHVQMGGCWLPRLWKLLRGRQPPGSCIWPSGLPWRCSGHTTPTTSAPCRNSSTSCSAMAAPSSTPPEDDVTAVCYHSGGVHGRPVQKRCAGSVCPGACLG